MEVRGDIGGYARLYFRRDPVVEEWRPAGNVYHIGLGVEWIVQGITNIGRRGAKHLGEVLRGQGAENQE